MNRCFLTLGFGKQVDDGCGGLFLREIKGYSICVNLPVTCLESLGVAMSVGL
jgi:hypothetical protein